MTDNEIELLVQAHVDSALETILGEYWNELGLAQQTLAVLVERVSAVEQALLKHIARS